ncbi:MAG TPA: HAD family phosphatase [Terriglobales bacterium]|jgi:putative hydrolase of the HAD superfamily|nr:HAD family phosphatase [Terriglobales bacterium]
MPATKLRAIIFDIGRVLVRVDVARAMQGLASGTSLTPSELWSAIEKDPRWPDWQEGRIKPRDWYHHLANRLGGGLTFEQFTEVWNRALDPVPIHDDSLFKSLSPRYRLALLSNTDPIHVRNLESTYSFFAYFPSRIYSCAVGASKPDPLIYREALRAVKARAEEALYIDDIAAYVEAAQRLGMKAIQFQSPAQLASALQSFGVDVD